MKRIGFVGLGHMGLPMAINLVKAGYTVMGLDLQPTAVDNLVAAGGIRAHSLEDIAGQDIIITMLQTGQQVQNVCFGPQGLFQQASQNNLYIDCSSIDVETARLLHAEAKEHGLIAVDAPVSGGEAGAHAGTLTIMVGGTQEAFEQAKSILNHVGKNIIHTGVAGTGQAAKICNNMILGISMIAVSEAFTLAKHLHLTPQKLFEVVTHSSGQCWAMSHYVPVPGILENVPANRDYQPGFTVAMMLKDLCLSQHTAESVGVKTNMGEKATELYQKLSDNGMSHLDFSAIIELIDRLSSNPPEKASLGTSS
jgi:3-hydroxyisobutyrate dehydrogenase